MPRHTKRTEAYAGGAYVTIATELGVHTPDDLRRILDSDAWGDLPLRFRSLLRFLADRWDDLDDVKEWAP